MPLIITFPNWVLLPIVIVSEIFVVDITVVVIEEHFKLSLIVTAPLNVEFWRLLLLSITLSLIPLLNFKSDVKRV